MASPSSSSSSSPAAELQLAQGDSGINMASFVSSKLSGDRNQNSNYISWKEEMLGLLESQDLIGFIDGNAQPNDDVDWRRTDWLVKAFILGALSDEVLQIVAHLRSAVDVWLLLEKEFSSDNPPPPPPPPPSKGQSPAAETPLPDNVAMLRGDRYQNNYTSWKQQVLGLLEAQGLVGFVDGEAPPPPPDDIGWRRTDWLVKGLILGALSDGEALKSVVSLDSARDVWLALENEFSTDQPQLSYYPPPPPQPQPESNYPPTPPSNYAPQSPPPLYNYPPPPSNYPPLLPPPSNYPVAPPPSNYPPPPSNYPPLLPPPSNYLPPPSNYPAAPPPPAQQPQGGYPINNVVDLVSVKLSWHSDWNSYNLWKQEMLLLLQSRNLAGFLDVRAHPPPNSDVNYGAWRQSDGMVKGWILEAVSNEIAGNVAHLESAKDVWLELENDFLTSKLSREEENEWLEKLELYKLAISGDWAKAEVFLRRNPGAIRARVSFTLETPLHIAVGSDTSVSLVEKLVELSDDATLSIRDGLGFNPLHVAARTGNYLAAVILINKLPDLLYALSNNNVVPLHLAAEYGHRTTTELLMLHTRDDRRINPFAGHGGLLLLRYLITAGFLDMALDLVNRYPYLARMRSRFYGTALNILANKDTTFASQSQLSFYGRLVNSLPCVKRIHIRKWMREQGRRLAKSICMHMESLGFERASYIYIPAMLRAAQVGNHEIVEVIVGTFPQAIYSIDGSTQSSFLHWAVKNRSEKVFNLLYQTSNHRYHYSNRIDSRGNSILHMAAFLAPPYKLNLVSGAALQMQRELQWFKEVEKFVSPYIKEVQNHAGMTPTIIFTEEHKDLKAHGEKWMKDTANSCTIAAALIVTVVFAAAITVPGGNQSDTGYPMMWKESAFTIFAVSDAISLFTSTTSLLMFLSILTSRYAEQDFLYALPKRLGIGLVTLFLSILFMMAAFSSTVYLVFGRKHAWVLIPAAALTCLPISSFVLLQFPLLIAVISSTYGKGIFGKQSNRPFH